MEKQNIKAKISLQGWQGPRREKVEETYQDSAEETERPDRYLPDLVRKALDAFEKRLGNEDLRPTLAEYLKLLQIEQEVTKQDKLPREITVTWVEPEADYSEE
jgi:hypothetical protein